MIKSNCFFNSTKPQVENKSDPFVREVGEKPLRDRIIGNSESFKKVTISAELLMEVRFLKKQNANPTTIMAPPRNMNLISFGALVDWTKPRRLMRNWRAWLVHDYKVESGR